MIAQSEAMKQAKASGFTSSCGAEPPAQPPPEKCAVNARANEPKPPRVASPDPDSEAAPDGERPESPLKKLLRDHDPPDPPWLLDVDPRGGHSAPGFVSAAIPGRSVAQFSRGISAKALPPTAKLPISSSATWLERFAGAAVGIATGRRLPNSGLGLVAMISRSCRRR
jgi:hypothetical protein